MSIENLSLVTGDVAVHRNAALGGGAKVRGSVKVGHNLIVEGWLLADNVKWPNVGLFDSVNALMAAYSDTEGALIEPKPGWTAGVIEGSTVMLYYYKVEGGWTNSGLPMSAYIGGNSSDVTGLATRAYVDEGLLEKANIDEVYTKEQADAKHDEIEATMKEAGVKRITYTDFQNLEDKSPKTLYAVTTKDDELRYLYIGTVMIAKKSDDGSSWGFPYTFPIVFGR